MELHPNNWDASESNSENIIKSISMTNHFRDLKVLHLVLQCLFFESVALPAYHCTNDNLITAQKKVPSWWILLHTTVLMLPECSMYLPVAVFLEGLSCNLKCHCCNKNNFKYKT